MQCIVFTCSFIFERQILGGERIIMLRKLIFRTLILSLNFKNLTEFMSAI